MSIEAVGLYQTLLRHVAGLLAIAIFGIVMIRAFGSELNHSLAQLSLSPAILGELPADEIRLAGLQVPLGLNPSTSTAIMESVKESFVFGFRHIDFQNKILLHS